MTRSARAFTFPSTKAQIKRLIAAAREFVAPSCGG